MKKIDIINLNKALNECKTNGSILFRYKLIKNINNIKSEIDSLNEVKKGITEILEPFDKERLELIKKIGILNKETGVITVPKEKMNEFNEEIKPLFKKYDKIIKEYQNKMGEYQNILQEEISSPLNFLEIKIEDCPQEISTSSLELLMQLGIIK